MSSVDWNLITDTIEEQKCVLFIGPELLNVADKSFTSNLYEQLKTEIPDGFRFFDNEDLFKFQQSNVRTTVGYKVKNYYKNFESPEIYYKIAQIPFNLIVSINPDSYMRDAFRNQGFDTQFSFYNKKHKIEEVETPTKDNPLIYNLFGSIEQHDSMILSHDEMFMYLHSILGAYEIPIELQNALKNADNFIFLGFKLDRWYVQLIMQLLNFYNSKGNLQYALNEQLSEDKKKIISEQLNIVFVDNQIVNFVEELHKLCKGYEILRIPSATAKDEADEFEKLLTSQKVQKLIEKAEYEKAIDELKKFLEEHDEELLEDVILNSNRLSRIQRKVDKGIVDNKEADIEFAKIADSLLQINKEVKSLE